MDGRASTSLSCPHSRSSCCNGSSSVVATSSASSGSATMLTAASCAAACSTLAALGDTASAASATAVTAAVAASMCGGTGRDHCRRLLWRVLQDARAAGWLRLGAGVQGLVRRAQVWRRQRAVECFGAACDACRRRCWCRRGACGSCLQQSLQGQWGLGLASDCASGLSAIGDTAAKGHGNRDVSVTIHGAGSTASLTYTLAYWPPSYQEAGMIFLWHLPAVCQRQNSCSEVVGKSVANAPAPHCTLRLHIDIRQTV